MEFTQVIKMNVVLNFYYYDLSKSGLSHVISLYLEHTLI